MSVVFADGTYAVHRPTGLVVDSQGATVPAYADDPDWTGEGQAELQADRSWVLRLDPSAWPLAYNDMVVLPSGVRVVVREATLDPFEDPGGLFAEVRVVNVTAQPLALAALPAEGAGG